MTALAGRNAGERDTGERDGAPGDSPVLRWIGLVWLGAFLILLANDPGRMFFDTKLSIDLNAWGYYASLWHLMDPLNTFGALNNQAVGYAVPMAPFYLAGQLAHVPVWLTERLWLAPWAVLPLTRAVRSKDFVIWPAARSAAVVLCMSGVNATVTIDALLLPGLFLLTYARGRRLVALALCWGCGVA